MKQLFYLVAIIILTATNAWSQVTTTLYYNDKWEITTLEKSIYKRVAELDLVEMAFDGNFKDYNKEGILIAEGFYKKGQKLGAFKTYRNGNLESVIEYLHNEFSLLNFVGANNEKSVTDGSGRFIIPITYLEYFFEIRNWKQGLVSGEFLNGQRVGKWVYQSLDDKISYEENYENGVFKHGIGISKGKEFELINKIQAVAMLGYNEIEKFNIDTSTLNNLHHFFKLYPPANAGTLQRDIVFPGGPKAMLSQITFNTFYPAEDSRKRIQGMVIVSLTIDEHGGVKSQQVVKSLSPTLDREALRAVEVIKKKLCPAMLDGKPYESVISIPITFKLG